MFGDRRLLLVWPMAIAITVAAQWPWLNLHDDVRFTLGPLRAAWAAEGPLDTFVHRPMANRLLMVGLDTLTAGPLPVPLPLREKITMAWSIVLVAMAAALLHLGLARRTTAVAAAVVALAVFGSLAWASEAYVLQPEWSATVLAVAALGLALLALDSRPAARHVLLGAAALLLAFAALQKYTTVTAALLALGVITIVDRRRGLQLAVLSGTLAVALLGISFWIGRYEWQWFTETSRLNPTSGLRFDAFGEWAVNWTFNNPVLLAWPAAAALAARLTGRRSWVWGSVLAFAVVLAVMVVQNQFFGYHGTALLPVAAAVTAFASARWTEQSGVLSYGLIVLAVWVAIGWALYPAPIAWRVAYQRPLAGWLLLVIIAIAVVVWLQSARSRGATAGPRRTRIATGLTVALLAIAVTFPGWPATPYGFFGQDRSRRSEVERQHELVADGLAVRELVGNAEVVYLADGETVYVVGSPTNCAYPAAVVLYRSDVEGVSQLRSFADNLACLSAPEPKFLVLQTWRVPFDRLDPRIEETVAREYACDRGAVVRELLVCSRAG